MEARQPGPERLPAWSRRHRQAENGKHHRHAAAVGEDASGVHKGHAPASNATLNDIALAAVIHRGLRHLPEANPRFMARRSEAPTPSCLDGLG